MYGLLLSLAWLWGAASAAPDAMDRAFDALAHDKPRTAVALLREALQTTEGPRQVEVRCLLGAALVAAGDATAAIATLEPVEVGASCGRRAAFLRAQAHESLGQAEAAVQLYEEVGGPRLGADRDAESAAEILRIARAQIRDPDTAGRGHRLWDAALQELQLDDETHLAWARELVDAQTDPRPSAGCAPMLRALLHSDTVADRVRAARVCPSAARGLLAAVEPTADVMRALAHQVDPATADLLRDRALDLTDPEDYAAQALELARQRERDGRLDAVEALLLDGSAESLALATRLLARAGRHADARTVAARQLETYPTHEGFADALDAFVHSSLAVARAALDTEEHDAARTAYDALVATAPQHDLAPRAATEAGLAALRAGDLDDAGARWRRVTARWPSHSAAADALHFLAVSTLEDDPTGATALELLKRHESRSPTFAGLAAELESTDVQITGPSRTTGTPVVVIGVRNLTSVELKLHRIDVAAFLRSGGRPATLRDLDVAVVAPDRTWTVPVPDPAPYQDQRFELPVEVPGPGLYAVTVGSPTEEARALVLVSDLVVVARTVGPDLAVATFDAAGMPVPGAAVSVITSGEAWTGTTSPRGLWVDRGRAAAGGVVLAQHQGSVAFVDVPSRPGPAEAELAFDVLLERPVALPGDEVGLRVRARRGDAPVRGDWTLWLARQDTSLTPIRASSDRRGLLHVALPVPPAPRSQRFEVMALPPGGSEPVVLTSLRVVPAAEGGRTLDVTMHGEDAVIQVREADGRPAEDVLVQWSDDAHATTDAAGRVRVPGPGPGIPWDITATMPGSGLRAEASRMAAALPEWTLVVEQDRLRPTESPMITLRGEGPARVDVFRHTTPVEGPPVPGDPWAGPPVEPGPHGTVAWSGRRAPARGLHEPVQTLEVVATLAGTSVTLEPLAEGSWSVRAVPLDADAVPAVATLQVEPAGLRLYARSAAGLGDVVSLAVDATPALVTAGGARLEWADVLRPGRFPAVPVHAAWSPEMTLSAVSAGGEVHERVVDVDPHLQVHLTEVPGPDGTTLVTAEVTDAAGAPVVAQVSLAGWDPRVASLAGWAPWQPTAAQASSQHTAIQQDFHDADPGSPIAGALQDEARRAAERRKAARARTGALGGTDLARWSSDEIRGIGGLGAVGSGRGGGGSFGAGAGRLSGIAGRPRIVGNTRWSGVRERVLWHVGRTDERGRVTATLAGPPALYHVQAVAMTDTAEGEARLEVDTRARVWMVAHEPAPGFPGDQMMPRVTVVNGTAEPIAGEVVSADGRWPVELGPGEARTLDVGALQSPGPREQALQLVQGEVARARASWSFPLAEGVAAERGPIVTVRVGPGGGLPFEYLALPDDPALEQEPWRHATRGRAALAALQHTDSERLRRATRDARDMLLLDTARPSPTDAAQALLFLAELRDSGMADVPPAELEAAAARLQSTATVQAGAWAAFARARAGLPIDPDLLAFLERAELSPEHAGLLARTLAWLGRADDARARLGDGLHADLARVKLGIPIDRSAWRAQSPPPIDSPARPDWIRAAGQVLRAAQSRATVRVAGNPATTLDLRSEGATRFLAEGRVEVDAPGALVERSNRPAPSADALPLRGVRLAAPVTGVPTAVPVSAETLERVGCNPCVIEVGESLQLAGPLRWVSGHAEVALRVSASTGAVLVRGVTAGRAVIRGLQSTSGTEVGTLHVTVVPRSATEARSPLTAPQQLALAQRALASGAAPTLPDPQVHPELVGAITELAMRHARATADDRSLVDQFQRLVAVQPSTALTLAEVRDVALAMRREGRPTDAARVWRAGLDAAFRAEAARLEGQRGALGDLTTAKLIYGAAHRYPDGAAVGDALALLPSQLWAASGTRPDEAEVAEGITALDVRLTAAAWDRELLALQPDHPRAISSGLRLARSLLALGAPERAARWADLVAERYVDDPLSDSATYLSALARTEAGLSGAEPLLRRLIDEPVPQPDGSPGASVHRSDAQLVMGRLLEAEGQWERAREAYREVAGDYPAAQRSVAALEERRISVPEVVLLSPGEEARLEVTLQGVDEVVLRAYAVDLRTIFVRDGGLEKIRATAVAGVSPTWSATRRMDVGPFPVDRILRLPLSGAGAWLVHLEQEGVRATTLVVRSALRLHALDGGGLRRVSVRRGTTPAARIEGRAHTAAGVRAITTDVRGVAEVAEGAAVLMFDGAHVAFSPPGSSPARPRSQPSPAPTIPLDQLDARLGMERDKDQEAYRRRFKSEAAEAMSLDAL